LLLEGGKMEPIEKSGQFIGPGSLCVIRKSGSRPNQGYGLGGWY
jgi:hypothetical protein